MNTSKKTSDTRLILSSETTSGPIVERRRALLTCVLRQDKAARTFAIERDAASFKVLYVGARVPMTAVVRRVGLRGPEVHEVVDIAGTAIWEGREHYQGKTYGQFVAYAVTVAHSDALERKAATRRIPVVLKVAEESAEELAIDPGRSPEDIAAAREAYGRLSPQEQKVVRMHTEGWSYQEIGVAIGCKGDCVRVIYQGAVERMREMVK